MRVFVASYASMQEYYAEVDDHDVDFEAMCSPQFASVSVTGDEAWVERIKQEALDDSMYMQDEGQEAAVRWEDSGWRFPEQGRPNRSIACFPATEAEDEEVITCVVIQQVDASE